MTALAALTSARSTELAETGESRRAEPSAAWNETAPWRSTVPGRDRRELFDREHMARPGGVLEWCLERSLEMLGKLVQMKPKGSKRRVHGIEGMFLAMHVGHVLAMFWTFDNGMLWRSVLPAQKQRKTVVL